MDTKTILAMLLRDALKTIAGALVLHGWVSSGTAEALIGLGMLAGASFWSFWVTSGRTMAQASLDILRAKVLLAASRANANPASATAAIASVAAHVEATTPVAALAASAVPPVASAIALAICLAALGLGWPGTAHAQINRQPAVRAAPVEAATTEPRTTTHGLPCDLLNLLPGCQIQSQDDTGKMTTKPVELDLWKKITDAALPDLDYASALATAAGTGASGVRKQCWDSLITANKQASGLGVKNADGTSRAKPNPSLFTDVESLAEVLDNLAPGGPLWTACAGAAQLAKTNVLTLLNAMVTGATGMAALGVT